MYVCARLPPLCFFITPLCLGSLAAVQGVPGTDQVRAWDGGRSRKRSGGKRWIYYPQLTSSYCIKLPWTISKGLAEQSKQSGFIKKGLGGVGGRQRWHPSRGRISSMSPPTLSVLRAWGLQPPLLTGGTLLSVLRQDCRAAPGHGSASWWDMNMYAG